MTQLEKPIFYGAVITTPDGEARVICMVIDLGKGRRGFNYVKIDTTLNDLKFAANDTYKDSFQNQLRGLGSAGDVSNDSNIGNEDLIRQKLLEAYGENAEIKIKEIENKSLLSLFI